jgi:hypothetical protein
MVNKLLFVALILLLLPTAIAVTTEINVKTLPRHKVFISIMDSSQTQYLKVLDAVSDSKGLATVKFDDASINIFKIALKVKSGEVVVLDLKKFSEGYNAGQTVDIEYFPEGYIDPFAETCDSDHLSLCEDEDSCTGADGHWYDDVCNVEPIPEPEPEVIAEETEESADEAPITGRSIGDDTKSLLLSNDMYWYVGIGLFAVIILLFVIRTALKHRGSAIPSGGIKIKPKTPEDPKSKSASSQLIEDAERKIKEAQGEINKIKNKEKIEAARKRIQKEQDDLKKLEEGTD